MRFVTSVARLVKSSYNSFAEVTRVVWVLIWFWAHLPHIEFNFSFAITRLLRVFRNGCLVQSNFLCAPVVLDVFVHVFLTLNSRWVAWRFFFQYQEHIDVLGKLSSWIVVLVVAGHLLFPQFKPVHQTITHFYVFADLIRHPFSNYTPLLIRLCTAALFHCVGTSRTQREH